MTDTERIQKIVLNIMDAFIDYCEKHALRYYLIGGALLGSIRHKGFIPWDDDVDIGMPRRDFDRFHELIKEDIPEGFGICTRFSDPDWHFAMSQFYDKESKVEIHLAEKPRIANIWIDIFPLDGLPDNKVRRNLRVKNILFHRYVVQMTHISTQVEFKRKRSFPERALLSLFRHIPLYRVIRTERIIDDLETILRKSDFDKSTWCGNMLGRAREKEIMRRRWFGTPIKGIFEGREVNIPENSHEILKALYGDYMKLPPEEDRRTHGVRFIE